jgi:DNA-binding CsgD family transcriptional regulator
VTIELREHALAHAARILRESGATPAQMKVGIQLAMGKSKPQIADALGIELSSVASLAKKLYQTLDIHSSAELATKIWLGDNDNAAHGSRLPGQPALCGIFATSFKRLTHPLRLNGETPKQASSR